MEFGKAALILLIPIVFISGCVGGGEKAYAPTDEQSAQETTASSETTQIEEVQSLEISTSGFEFDWIENWDSDPEIDGIEVSVYPKDRNGYMVQANGTVNANLYWAVADCEDEYCFEYTWEKGKLIQTWKVPITTVNYGDIGADVRLEYKSDIEYNDEDYGWLEITFTTDSGKNVTAREKGITLGEA